jgi:CubicO group peptidase (beta-lactamase class C family)
MIPSVRSLAWLLLVLLSALAMPGPSRAAPVDEKAVDAIVNDALKSWQVPGAALAIVRGDEVVFLKGYGVRQHGGDQPVTPDTLFAIASCTKAFTAAAIGVLVDDGVASWDDPVRKHLPYFRLGDPLAGEQATLRDLLCHRTGLSRHDILWLGTPLGREEIVRRVAHVPLARSFRSTYLYNNIMYVAAGLAAGAASGGTWDDLVHKRLLEPLGMKDTTCSSAAAEKSPNHARPHRRARDGTVEVLPWHKLETTGPAGSIHSSVRNMTRWVHFQLGDGTWEGKRLLARATLDETHTPQVVVRREGIVKTAYPDSIQVSYGLGWVVHDHRGFALLSHTGGLEGFRARVVLVPKQKLGIVFLMNSGVASSYASAHYVVTNGLLDLLLELPKKDWNAYYQAEFKKMEAAEAAARRERDKKRRSGTKPSHELAAYAGTYEDAAYGAAVVSVKEDALRLKWGQHAVRLEHFHYDTFLTRKENPKERNPLDDNLVLFRLDADGTVASLTLLGREFRRAPGKPARTP